MSKTYEDGLNEAWELARDIITLPKGEIEMKYEYTEEEYKQMVEMMEKYFPDAEYREYSYLDYANSSPMRDGLEIRTFLNEL